MLTAFQVEVIAFWTDGGLICRDCAVTRFEEQGGEAVAEYTPAIRYEVDEYDAESSRDYLADDDQHTDCACTLGVTCDDCGNEIVEPFEDTYAHQTS